jgi:hypothetical protein
MCNFLQFPVTSYPSGTNILLSTVFSNTLNLFSSLGARDVSHLYKTTSKTVVLYRVITYDLYTTL